MNSELEILKTKYDSAQREIAELKAEVEQLRDIIDRVKGEG